MEFGQLLHARLFIISRVGILKQRVYGLLVINWDSDGDKVKTNLWNLVWNRLSGYEYDGGTFYEGTDMEIDYPASKPKGLVDKLTQNTAEQKRVIKKFSYLRNYLKMEMIIL